MSLSRMIRFSRILKPAKMHIPQIIQSQLSPLLSGPVLQVSCYSHPCNYFSIFSVSGVSTGTQFYNSTLYAPLGEGDGTPLQCSCLEDPRDGEPGGLPSLGSHRVGHD